MSSDLVLPALVAILLLPAVVALLVRKRLRSTEDDPGAGEPVPAEAEKQRNAITGTLGFLTIAVTVLQAAAGYEFTQVVDSLAGSEGPGGWREGWDGRRLVDVAVAVGPALVLGALLISALRRRDAHRVHGLALWGNITLVPVGLVLWFVVSFFVPSGSP
jgi:hypothetical protein